MIVNVQQGAYNMTHGETKPNINNIQMHTLVYSNE